jgi:uncharacterized membrane protein YhaH (DUF805 family)
MRHPVAAGIPPGRVEIGVPFRTRSRDQFWMWRIFAAALVVGSQTVQLRSATDAQMAATMGAAPVVEACAEWVLMATWSLYVVLEFRRAARVTTPR